VRYDVSEIEVKIASQDHPSFASVLIRLSALRRENTTQTKNNKSMLIIVDVSSLFRIHSI
jgi:hypothetical protein